MNTPQLAALFFIAAATLTGEQMQVTFMRFAQVQGEVVPAYEGWPTESWQVCGRVGDLDFGRMLEDVAAREKGCMLRRLSKLTEDL